MQPAKRAAHDKFRSRFITDVPARRATKRKLAIQVGHLESLAIDCNFGAYADLRDQASYVLAYTSGIRIGHFSSKRVNMQRHILTWAAVVIKPNLVALWLFSTKTRSACAKDGTWTAVAGRPHGMAALDPVRIMNAWKRASFTGDPLLPVFPALQDPTLPLTRREFTACLRRRLQRALRHLPNSPVVDVASFSGISFRYGLGTALWGKIPAHRLSEMLDHAPPPGMRSTAHYGRDATLSIRAANTLLLPFANGF